tara:strand:- start:761 stop:889 length:129 start_codon:yes stop_codon:yes gene_type:complete
MAISKWVGVNAYTVQALNPSPAFPFMGRSPPRRALGLAGGAR